MAGSSGFRVRGGRSVAAGGAVLIRLRKRLSRQDRTTEGSCSASTGLSLDHGACPGQDAIEGSSVHPTWHCANPNLQVGGLSFAVGIAHAKVRRDGYRR